MENLSFQFKGFKIIRSYIERKKNEASEKISLAFKPKGFINENNSTFEIHLNVEIEDKNEAFKIEIASVATYFFEKKETLEHLDNYFYVNAPAILFPYIRAYISTLTNLSGFEPINLPTLNMVELGKELKGNTTTV